MPGLVPSIQGPAPWPIALDPRDKPEGDDLACGKDQIRRLRSWEEMMSMTETTSTTTMITAAARSY